MSIKDVKESPKTAISSRQLLTSRDIYFTGTIATWNLKRGLAGKW